MCSFNQSYLRKLIQAVRLVVLALVLATALALPAGRPPPLSKESVRMVRAFREPIHVTAFVTRGYRELNEVVDELTDVLDTFRLAAPRTFKYEVVEIRSARDGRLARAEGLTPLAFFNSERRDPPAGPDLRGYLGFSMTASGEKVRAPHIRAHKDVWNLELLLLDRLHELYRKILRRPFRVGVFGPRGEASGKRVVLPMVALSPLLLQQAERDRRWPADDEFDDPDDLLPPHTEFVSTDLLARGAALEPEISALIVLQPTDELTDDELIRIDSLVMAGIPLIIMASACNLSVGDDGVVGASLDPHGLDRLLHGYGIELRKEAIAGWPRCRDGGDFLPRFECTCLRCYALGEWDRTHVLSFRLSGLSELPCASGLVLRSSAQPSALYRVLGLAPQHSASDFSAEPVSCTTVGESPTNPADRVVAASVEGPLRSAFGANAWTDNGHVMIISSSQLLSNPPESILALRQRGALLRGPDYGRDQLLASLAGVYELEQGVQVRRLLKNVLVWASIARVPN